MEYYSFLLKEKKSNNKDNKLTAKLSIFRFPILSIVKKAGE